MDREKLIASRKEVENVLDMLNIELRKTPYLSKKFNDIVEEKELLQKEIRHIRKMLMLIKKS